MSQSLPPSGTAPGFQKLCDALDWSDPHLARIIAEDLRDPISYHRRQWEFAAILRILGQAGMLDRDRRGISFGAGREPLTHVVSRKAGHITATDLYASDTVWKVARTEDPRAFVLAPGCPPHEPERIAVERMDMRELGFPDESFDFAYSTGAIEHIGDFDDFLRHFTEVRRVLRNGGIYVLTTVLCFADTTIRHPHQYYFAPEELVEVARRSGLRVDPVFDLSLAPMIFNRPVPDRILDLGLPALSAYMPNIILERGGDVTAANTLVLRRDDARPQEPVRMPGWRASRAFVERSLRDGAARIWKPWTPVDMATSRLRPGMVRGRGGTALGSRPVFFGGPTRVQLQLWVEGRSLSPASRLRFDVWRHRRGWPKTPELVLRSPLDLGAAPAGPFRLSFDAVADSAYEILGVVDGGPVQVDAVHALARHEAPPG